MPFRARVRRVFGRSASISDAGSVNTAKTIDSNSSTAEEEPKAKYRGAVDPAHKALMDNFSFRDAYTLRRRSGQSQYSPFGSRIPTRNNSVDVGANEGWGLHLDVRKRHTVAARGKSSIAQFIENVDEHSSPANGVGSHHHSISEPASSVPSAVSQEVPSDDAEDNGGDNAQRRNMPFTEADINKALTKSISKRSDS